jgi:hypothetical protein
VRKKRTDAWLGPKLAREIAKAVVVSAIASRIYCLRDDSALHGPAATGWPSSIGTALGGPLVDIRIRLLEAIGRDGPISRAANAVPMSGKAASPLAAKLRRSLQTSRSLQMTPQRSLVLAFLLGTAAVSASADEGQIAVAANFTAPMKEIIAAFEADSGHKIQASYGSTGKLYAQIKNGAPFQALLAADQKRPALLAEEGVGEPDSRFTYAIGTLVFWSADPDFVDSDGEALKKGDFEKLSLANPKLAPYGEASIQTLEALGLKEEMEPRFVMGENMPRPISSSTPAMPRSALWRCHKSWKAARSRRDRAGSSPASCMRRSDRTGSS